MLGLLMDRLDWNLNLNLTMDDTDTDNEDTTKDAVESGGKPTFTPNATLTRPDGTTVTTKDFAVKDVNLELDADGVNEVSSGLSEAIEDAQREFQLTVEVPTKTLTCPNCSHDNEVPVWAFVDVDFSGDLEPLSGEYALGHQCEQCGFPY